LYLGHHPSSPVITTHLVDGEVDLRDRAESRNQATSPRLNLSVMRSAIRAISVYTRSRAPEEFGPVAAASDARSAGDRHLDCLAVEQRQPNRDNPPFDNPDLRRAMALALDRKAFIDILAGGQGGRIDTIEKP
jgi:ABC-type transport system substrate-binding protein